MKGNQVSCPTRGGEDAEGMEIWGIKSWKGTFWDLGANKGQKGGHVSRTQHVKLGLVTAGKPEDLLVVHWAFPMLVWGCRR